MPALCAEHRQALSQFGAAEPKVGFATHLGGIVDQMLRTGQAPTHGQVNSVLANFASTMLGREVTVEEVNQIRTGHFEQGFRKWAERMRQKGAQAQQQRQGPQGPRVHPHDPDIAQKIEYAKALGRARAVMGFGAKDPLTEEVIKKRQRELARKHHPDMPGGSTEMMTKINNSADLLIESL